MGNLPQVIMKRQVGRARHPAAGGRAAVPEQHA